MEKRLGACALVVLCMLLAGHLAAVKARGVKHRFKWNKKPLPSAQITEAHSAENHSGTFIRQGRKLDIDFGAEGNRYYEAHYWQFPDGIHFDGCSEANVTKEMFVARCINSTQAANQAEFGREQQDSKLYQRILWRLIKELCAVKRCDFWSQRGAGSRAAVDRPVMLCLLGFFWFVI